MHGNVEQDSVMQAVPGRLHRGVKSVCMAPFMAPLRRRYRGLATILMYHRIVDRRGCCSGFDPNLGLSVDVSDFERQLQYLSEHHPCVSLGEMISGLCDGGLARDSVVLTFDDGYRDNLELALPLLEKYKVPATIYVTTGLVEKRAGIWWYEQEHIVRQLSQLSFRWRGTIYDWELETSQQKDTACEGLNLLFKNLPLPEQQELMTLIRGQCDEQFSYEGLGLSWDELRQLDANPLITIGAHTINHPNLRLCSQDELLAELDGSRRVLEKELGHAVPHAAYPFGTAEQAGPREFRAAKDLGFQSVCTTRLGHIHPEHRDHLTALPRVCIDFFDRFDRFHWKLSGGHAMLLQKGRRVVVE